MLWGTKKSLSRNSLNIDGSNLEFIWSHHWELWDFKFGPWWRKVWEWIITTRIIGGNSTDININNLEMLFGILKPLKTLVVVHSLNICNCGMEFSTWMIIVGTLGHLIWTCNEVSFEFDHWYQKRRHFLLNALLLFVKEMTSTRPSHKLVVIKISNYDRLFVCGSFKKAPYYKLHVDMRLF